MSLDPSIVPAFIQKLKPYVSARRLDKTGETWLNANERPAVPTVELSIRDLNRYPQPQPPELISAYSAYCGVPREQILVTRGIDEGIELLIRGFCAPGVDTIAITPPTYGMYSVSAATHNVGVQTIPLEPDYTLDADAVLEGLKGVRLVFVCSPNNPTGGVVAQDVLIRILEGLAPRTLLVLDEAYIEFSTENERSALLAAYSNLIILRTLSKAFGLAGIRVGFLMAQPEILETIQKIQAPYPIPAPSEQIARTALSQNDLNLMRDEVRKIIANRERVATELCKLASVLEILPSQTNFLTLRVESAAHLMDALREQGVIIRDQSYQPGLSGCVRLTIGTDKELEAFMKAMHAYDRKGNK